MQTLQGWQKNNGPSIAMLARRMFAGLALVCMLVAFAVFLRMPYERPTIQVAVLAPMDKTRGEPPTMPSVRSKSSDWEFPDVDLANLFCHASGQRIEQSLRSTLPHSLMLVEGQQLRRQADSLQDAIKGLLPSQSTLVIYTSGVLSMESKQPAICDHGHEATHGGGELLLLPFIEKLQRTGCKQILLCIDLVPPHSAAPSIMAAPLIVDQLAESLEQGLAQHAGRTPLAVCVSLNSANEVIQRGWTATSLASALADSLEAEAADGKFDLNRLKNRLVGSTQSQTSGPSAIWLTSIHWPAASTTIELPVVHDDVFRHGAASASAVDESASASIATKIPSIEQTLTTLDGIDLEKIDDDQLWRVGELALESLCNSNVVDDQTPFAAWLPLPAPLSFRQRHPFTATWLVHVWNELKAADKLSVVPPRRTASPGRPTELHSSDRRTAFPGRLESHQVDLRQTSEGQPAELRTSLRTFVQYLVGLAQSNSDYFPSQQSIDFDPTNSLIVDVTIVRLNTSQSTAITASLSTLSQLTQAIDHSSDTTECVSAIEKLAKTQSRQYLELERCRTACKLSVPWSTVQRIMRHQLVSLRAQVDLFQDAPDVVPYLHEAEMLSQQIREEIDLRPDSHPDAGLDLVIDRALAKYHAAIDRMTIAERLSLERSAAMCASLAGRTWTNVRGMSSQACRQAINDFAEEWRKSFAQEHDSLRNATALDSRIGHIAGQIQDLQRLISEPTLSRENKIEAILQLNRDAIAAVEATLLSSAGTNNSGMQSQRSAVEQGAARLFLRLVSSDRDRPAPGWVDSKLNQLIENNIDISRRQLQGATITEQADLQRWLTVWDQLAASLEESGIRVVSHRPVDWSLSVNAPSRLDMQRTGATTAACAITYEATSTAKPQMKADYDEQSLLVTLNEQNLRSGQSINVADVVTGSANSSDRESTLAKARVMLSIKRIGDRPVREPVVLVVSHGDSRRRAVIHVTTSQSPFVNVQLHAEGDSQLAEQGGNSHLPCLLLPNRQQSIELRLRSYSPTFIPITTQIWGVTAPPTNLPTGAVAADAVQGWLNQQAPLALLAQTAEVTLEPEVGQRIALAPAAGAVDFKQAPLSCTGLLIGITDTQSKHTQLEYCPLQVRHPHDYLQQQIVVNAERQTVEVTNRLNDAIAIPAVTVSHRLIDWPQTNVIAHVSGQLSTTAPIRTLSLSSNRSRSERLILLTEVDSWPGLWASAIDRSDNTIVQDRIASVSLSSNLAEGVVPGTDDDVTVNISTWSSTNTNDDQIELHVGWDRDLDRTLTGEPTLVSRDLRAISARYSGLTAEGAMLIANRVEPLQFQIPVAGLSNERTSLLAVLKQGDRILAQAAMPVIVDSQAPKVTKTLIENGERCLYGKPLVLHAEADDFGLSGVAKLEGAWSLDGRMQLSDDMQPLAGVLRPNGCWTLTLPTAALPEGNNILLVRAIDRAGNCSEGYRVNVNLHSQQELDEMAASATSVVTGTLLYVQLPQNGLKVELLRAVEEDKSKEAMVAKATSATQSDPVVVAATTSLTDGSFRLFDVRSGRYTLRVSGIVRGMRYEKTRSLEVDAPKHVAPILWRLDK